MKLRDRVVDFRRIKASELVPHPDNPKRHPQEQTRALKGVLNEIGFAGAILVRELPDGRYQIADGHARRELLGQQEVPCVVVDLNDDETKQLLVSFDPIARLAENNKEALEKLLSEVEFKDKAIIAALEKVAGESAWAAAAEPVAIQDPEPQIDKAAELQKKWGTQTGDIWQVGPHRLACGDCRDEKLVARLFGDKKARLVWTDPPYGVSYAAKNEMLNAISPGNRIQTPIAGDALKPDEVRSLFQAALTAVFSHCEMAAAIYATVPGGPLIREFIAGMEGGGFSFKATLIWVKQQFVLGRSDYHYRHEPILYGWIENGAHYFTEDRGIDSVFEVDKPHVSDMHPTMKPVELVAKMVANSSRASEVIYDPFVGSGTTILAAHQLNRIGLGIEKTPEYTAVGLERLTTLDPNLKPELQK